MTPPANKKVVRFLRWYQLSLMGSMHLAFPSMSLERIVVGGLFGSRGDGLTLGLMPDLTIIFGKNGTGKSTIFRTANGLLNKQQYILDLAPIESMDLIFSNGIIKANKTEAKGDDYLVVDYAFEDKAGRYLAPSLDSRQWLVYTRINQGADSFGHEFDEEIAEDEIAVIEGFYGLVSNNFLPRKKYTKAKRIDVTINSNDIDGLHKKMPSSCFLDVGRLRLGMDPDKVIDGYLRDLDLPDITRCRDDSITRIKGVDTLPIIIMENLLRDMVVNLAISDMNIVDRERENLLEKMLQVKLQTEILEFVNSNSKMSWKEWGFGRLNRLVSKIAESEGLGGQTEEEALNDQEILRKAMGHCWVRQYAEDLKFFISLSNQYLVKKRIKPNLENRNLFQVIDDESNENIDNLSAGESQLLTILYYAIFIARGDSILIIDEPELSMHISWQRRLARDLRQIARVNQSQIVLITHSPQIVDRYSNLVVELDYH
jgi:energy-coupling factor transporter ATP-binding protein EcfA2